MPHFVCVAFYWTEYKLYTNMHNTYIYIVYIHIFIIITLCYRTGLEIVANSVVEGQYWAEFFT